MASELLYKEEKKDDIVGEIYPDFCWYKPTHNYMARNLEKKYMHTLWQKEWNRHVRKHNASGNHKKGPNRLREALYA